MMGLFACAHEWIVRASVSVESAVTDSDGAMLQTFVIGLGRAGAGCIPCDGGMDARAGWLPRCRWASIAVLNIPKWCCLTASTGHTAQLLFDTRGKVNAEYVHRL